MFTYVESRSVLWVKTCKNHVVNLEGYNQKDYPSRYALSISGGVLLTFLDTAQSYAAR